MVDFVPPEKIKLNPEYNALTPPLTDDELSSLKESIRTKDQLESVKVKEDKILGKYIVLDGHHRVQILRELGKDVKIEVMNFDDPLEEKIFVIEINLQRRQLSNVNRVRLASMLVKLEKKLAKKRKQATLPKKGQKGFQSMSMQHCNNTGRVNEIVAKKSGLSARTVAKLQKIIRNGSAEQIKKIESGNKSISAVEREINKKLFKTKERPLPDGKYDVVYADPPYHYDREGSGSPPYPTLTKEEIINLKDKTGRQITDLFAKDCVIFTWTPRPKVWEAGEILRAWGFEPKTAKIWRKVKDGKSQRGTAVYYWSTTEVLILATKGSPGTPDYIPEDYLEAPRGEKHSEKPEEVRKEIEKMYPNRKYLELFGRKKVKDWTVWGNQIFDEDEAEVTSENKTAANDKKITNKKLDDFKNS